MVTLPQTTTDKVVDDKTADDDKVPMLHSSSASDLIRLLLYSYSLTRPLLHVYCTPDLTRLLFNTSGITRILASDGPVPTGTGCGDRLADTQNTFSLRWRRRLLSCFRRQETCLR
jgi:hypothetical protein